MHMSLEGIKNRGTNMNQMDVKVRRKRGRPTRMWNEFVKESLWLKHLTVDTAQNRFFHGLDLSWLYRRLEQI